MKNQKSENKNNINRNRQDNIPQRSDNINQQKSADNRFGQDNRQSWQSAGTNQYSPSRGEDE